VSEIPAEARLTDTYVRDWLEEAAWAGGMRSEAIVPWIEATIGQLRKGHESYGDSYLERTIEDLASNAAEEFEDGPAWLIVTCLRLYINEAEGLEGDDAMLIRKHFIRAAGLALHSWQEVQMGLAVFRQATT
jgi:hypothetical protein